MNEEQLEAALAQLVVRLMEIGRDFAACETPEDKRENAMAALEAVIKYLQGVKAPRETNSVFLALFADIENLQKGCQTEFLGKGAKRRGSPQKPR
ncbi:MAG TPA: hypothetical protein VKA90_06975, partial [Beijerinckiaceae bacterium]|nr:hypothetical protein [Beijerinckiaceae bacterium]